MWKRVDFLESEGEATPAVTELLRERVLVQDLRRPLVLKKGVEEHLVLVPNRVRQIGSLFVVLLLPRLFEGELPSEGKSPQGEVKGL